MDWTVQVSLISPSSTYAGPSSNQVLTFFLGMIEAKRTDGQAY